ncbi:MAG: nucleotidyltransferase family protein [Algoriphagus sp.]|uniref:nucleotidyltransferase family protein n=1 Tax=Algoriphagus sp. TaxID=1872435 RepID=UPI0026124F05|nr:nucleotidyltransferase family protein [Algoriphagus sp.]MDG1278243.1 nucleotidyltransferase family protein [Algoriphagus sp.]
MSKEINFKGRVINKEASILEAMKLMDQIDHKLLIITDENLFLGLLSAGDIQRAIISDKPLSTPVADIMRSNIRVASPKDSLEDIKVLMLKFRMELCPVLDGEHNILNIYFWEELFEEEKPHPKSYFDLPVVVMAGGFGTRMKPLTNVLPKPLIPVGDTTILEQIFKRFYKHGSSRFYLSVNYKADLIEYYIKNQNLPYQISYFKEEKPMGTAGSMSLLKGKINETFFVSNCDIIVDQDYSEILDYHRSHKNEITIVAAMKNYPIPYGTIETTKKGKLVKLSEKPELTFKINSGMYILEPHLLDEIPDDTFFHITHLIEKVKDRDGSIGVFPISEKSWKDIGNLEEYYKTISFP